MPLFSQASATIANIRDYALSAMSVPFTAAQQAASMFRQSSAKLRAAKEEFKEVKNVLQLAFECSQLVPQETQEYIHDYQFSELLDEAIKHDSAITLHDCDSDLSRVSCEVDEYLAAAQLLTQYDSQALSRLLRCTMHNLLDASNARDPIPINIEDSITAACILIENVIFNRSQQIQRAIDYGLRQYIDINEMLQFMHILQLKICSIPTEMLTAYMSHKAHRSAQSSQDFVTDTQRDSTYELRTTEQLFDEASGLVNMTDVVCAYLDNAQHLQDTVHPSLCDREIYTENMRFLREYGLISMQYDVMSTIQVFAALAIRRHLYYEMQRNFNDAREVQINEAIRCDEQSELTNKIVQVRIAHMIRTYYTYSILEHLLHSLLATNITQPSTTMLMNLHSQAKIAALIVMPKIVDEFALDAAVELTEYLYSAALIRVINGCRDRENTAQIRHILKAINKQQKEEVANNAILHVLHTYIPQSVMSKLNKQTEITLTQQEKDMVSDIMNIANPLEYGHDTQIINYFKKQAIQIFNRLPDERFDQLRRHVMLPLIDECFVKLQQHNHTYALRQKIEECEDFYISPEYYNIMHAIELAKTQLPVSTHPKHVMMEAIINAITLLHHTRDSVLMTRPMFCLFGFGAQTMYVSTGILMKQAYDKCVNDTTRYSAYTAIACGTAILSYSPQYVYYPLYFIQHIVQLMRIQR